MKPAPLFEVARAENQMALTQPRGAIFFVICT
jgi:hypothetical protein